MNNAFFYQTPIGRIGIRENGTTITNVFFDQETAQQDIVTKETPLLKEAGQQLRDYLAGKRRSFDLLLAPDGTEFQQRVWQALQQIPCGETRSYGEIAKSIGQPKAARPVGMANNRNPILIFIPCHRVIGANGKMVGYGGGLHIKNHLLELEKRHGLL
jgi:methylated-DNA-[protein]-cysteine S-methyltransferase